MKMPPLLSIAVAFAGVFLPVNEVRGEAVPGPKWQTPWQDELARWLESLTQEELTVEDKEFRFDAMDPAEKARNWQLSQGYGPTLPYAYQTIKLPASEFVWSSIWRGDLPVVQGQLKKINVTQGQIWTPTHPSLACNVAWLYSWDRPWNPYYHDAAVGRRAAVLSVVTLIMTRSGLDGRNVHTGTQGFGLTFNAFTYQRVSGLLPEPARKAWEEGLRWYADALARAQPNGPENMQLSAPVGIYQTGLALNDEELKAQGLRSMMDLFSLHYSLAGHIRDAGVPDGSYNGISLHRLAEFWAISQAPEVLAILRQAYRLKELNVLPEPEGETLSPSHFNARCPDGFDYDQYQGREVMLLPQVPEAAWFARRLWGLEVDHEKVVAHNERNLNMGSGRFPAPLAWGTRYGGLAPNDWGRVLALPYALYHSSDPVAAEALMKEAERPYILRHDRYTTSLGGEFHFIRRPAYGAIFYTGPAVHYDNGATNSHGILQKKGGYHMGFGGGGLSAFWTPEGGSLILGRMSGREGYERLKGVGDENQYNVAGWQDWLNNQIIGETQEGKIVTSSRTAHPRHRMNEEGTLLEIRGTIPKALTRQGSITDAEISYKREYRFNDEGIECVVEASADKPLKLRTFYETLPMVEHSGRERLGQAKTLFLDAEGKEIAPVGDRYEGVHTVRHDRFKGGVRIVFSKPVTIAMISETFPSNQFRRMTGRSLLIELPVEISQQQPVALSYHLYPDAK